jgi:hypothetical protein
VENLTFVDGRATAGWAARLVKDMSKLTPTTKSSRRSEHASLSRSHKTKMGSRLTPDLYFYIPSGRATQSADSTEISWYKPGNIDSVSSRGASAHVI